MSSFLPVGEQEQQEIDAVRNQILANEPMTGPTVENESLNEYQVSHLATGFSNIILMGKVILSIKVS